MDYVENHSDSLLRYLQALTGDAGHAISLEMLACAQASQKPLQ